MNLRKPEEFDTCMIGTEPGVIVFLHAGSYFTEPQKEEILKLPAVNIDVFQIEDFPPSYIQDELKINGSPYFLFHHSDYIVLRFAGFLWAAGLEKLLSLLLTMDITTAKREVGELV
jgi:hypothetical protein